VIAEDCVEICQCNLDPARIGPARGQLRGGYVAGIHLFADR
jgi:hypothetical protein